MEQKVGVRVHGAKLPLALQVDLPVYAVYGRRRCCWDSIRSRGEASTRHGAETANRLSG